MAIRKKYRLESISLKKNNYSGYSGKKPGILKIIFRALFGKAFLRFALGVFLLLLIVGGVTALGLFLYYSKDLPSPEKLIATKPMQSTKIFDKTGKTLLYEIHGEEKRTVVKSEDISPFVKKATVAAEDQDFYNHKGIDPRGIARAIWHDIKGGELQEGGSTITQQLIKNALLTSEKTFARKIKELILAIELERKFSKDEILTMYLNEVPYGSNAYGIEAASQTFFGKSAKDLTLTESAMLASLPRSTTYLSPYGLHKDKLRERYEYILDRMKTLGHISEAEYNDAIKVDIIAQVKKFREKILAPHFVMYVKDYLVKKYGEFAVENGGLKVYTTLDYDLQDLAEKTVEAGVEKNTKKYNVYNGALTAVDPKTGGILAMVGSKNYFAEESLPQGCKPGKDCKFDPNTNVALSLRSPGSSYKPFVYATGFKKGYTPDTMFFDLKTEFNSACGADFKPKTAGVPASSCYHPQNFNGKFNGPVTVRQALATSLNIPAVKMLYLAGIDDSINTGLSMGITTFNDPSKYGLALVLGGGGVKLLEETGAYGVFANEGKKHNLTPILKVEDNTGKVLENNEDPGEGVEVLKPEITRQISDILSDNDARAPMFGARSPLFFADRPVAVKTGTANEFRDAWTVGYTPSLAVGVWVGNNNNEAMSNGEGVYVAAPIWHSFLEKALAGKPVEQFTKPNPVDGGKAVLNGQWSDDLHIKIDKACGNKLATDLTPPEQTEERIYRQVHSILYFVQKDDPRGTLPVDPSTDPQFSNWEASIQAWVAENNYFQKPPTEACSFHTADNKPFVKIISPADSTLVNLNKPATIDIEADASSSFGIKEVNFYLDDSFIEAKTLAPWKIKYQLPISLAAGEHSLSARAFDQYGNTSIDKISFEIERDSQGPNVTLKYPVCNKTMCLLSADVTDKDSTVASVSFYYRPLGSTNEFAEIKGDVLSQSSIYQEIWMLDSSIVSGDYELYSIAVDRSNNLSRSTILNFKIDR